MPMTDYGKSVYGGPVGERIADCGVLGDPSPAIPAFAQVGTSMSMAIDAMQDARALLDMTFGGRPQQKQQPNNASVPDGAVPQLHALACELNLAMNDLRDRVASLRALHFGGC